MFQNTIFCNWTKEKLSDYVFFSAQVGKQFLNIEYSSQYETINNNFLIEEQFEPM